MRALLAQLNEITRENIVNSNAKLVKLHESRNKFVVRDRINKLIDTGTSFLELSQVAGYQMYENDSLPAGGIVTGIGKISG